MEELTWNLDDVVSLEEFDSLFAEVERELVRYDEFYNRMGPDMCAEDFKEFIRFDEDMTKKTRRLYLRSALMEDADLKSETAKLLKNRAQGLELEWADISLKLWHWIKGKETEDKAVLDDENAKRLFKAVPDLEYILTYVRESAQHTLSESEESIIKQKESTRPMVLTDLRTLIETELTYFFKPRNAKRGKKINTQAELLHYVRSHNPDEREAAYVALLTKYQQNIDKFFMIYQAIVKNWDHDARLRGYKSPISVRNQLNHVSDETVNSLLEACSENKDIFQNYFKFKAREIGMKKLRRFDIFAPLNTKRVDISFSEAKKIVLSTLEGFSSEFAGKAKQIFDARHIDSHPRPGKRGGGLCCPVPEEIPYVFLNYINNLKGLFSLAHELGHGIHFLYANQNPLSSQVEILDCLPLMEAASTLVEMVVFEKLFEAAEDAAAKKSMLLHKMDSAYNTILRQNYFVDFEIKAHEEIGKGITAEELSDIYFEKLQEQFGDSVDINPLFRYEWAFVHHIVNTPFYCYAYNFGELLSLSLFSEYKKQGDAFLPKIEQILSYGQLRSPQQALKDVGMDINSKDFWQSGFDIIKEWQAKLESY